MRMSREEYLNYVSRRDRVIPLPVLADTGPERALHDFIMDDCATRGWIALHGAMSKRTHRTQGEPDFVILASNCRVILVECKSATGKLSVDQAALHAWSRKLGHHVHIVRSKEDWLDLVHG